MGLRLYTQPRCQHCIVMKNLLEDADYTYQTIDISKDRSGLEFLREKGHKTVPQLYWNSAWVIQEKTTKDLTALELSRLVDRA